MAVRKLVGCFHDFDEALAQLRDAGGMILYHPHHIETPEAWQVLDVDDFISLYPDCEDTPLAVCRYALEQGGKSAAAIRHILDSFE